MVASQKLSRLSLFYSLLWTDCKKDLMNPSNFFFLFETGQKLMTISSEQTVENHVKALFI